MTTKEVYCVNCRWYEYLREWDGNRAFEFCHCPKQQFSDMHPQWGKVKSCRDLNLRKDCRFYEEGPNGNEKL